MPARVSFTRGARPMLPFSAFERAQARSWGNDDGSFFFPLLARKEGRSNPAPKGAARFARSVRGKSTDGMALWLRLRKECGSKCGQGRTTSRTKRIDSS